MPVTVTISKKLTDSHWLAIGSFKSAYSAACGPAEIILEQTADGLKPVLNSSIHPTSIMNRSVTAYIDAPLADVKPELKTSITFKDFSFTLKSATTNAN